MTVRVCRDKWHRGGPEECFTGKPAVCQLVRSGRAAKRRERARAWEPGKVVHGLRVRRGLEVGC